MKKITILLDNERHGASRVPAAAGFFARKVA